MQDIDWARGVLTELETRVLADDRDEARTELATIERALQYLWTHLTPDEMNSPQMDEDLYHFLMMTWDQVEPVFDKIRQVIPRD